MCDDEKDKKAFEEIETGIKNTIRTVETANLINEVSSSLKNAHYNSKISELNTNVKEISKDFVNIKVGPPQ